VTPLPPRPNGAVLPSLFPLPLTDGSTVRAFSWRGRDPVHLLSEEAPRQLGPFFVALCDALRNETQREPEFQSRDRIDGDMVYELTPDHRARWSLLGGKGNPALRSWFSPNVRRGADRPHRGRNRCPHRTSNQEIAAALLELHKAGVHGVLNVSAPIDPLQREALQQQWIPLAQRWDADVVEMLKRLECMPEEIHFVETFPLGPLRRTDFLYPMNSQWSISDMRRERLEKVIDRYLEHPIFGVPSAVPSVKPTTLAVLEWQEGDPTDSRVDGCISSSELTERGKNACART